MQVKGEVSKGEHILDWSRVEVFDDSGKFMPNIVSVNINIDAGDVPIMTITRLVRPNPEAKWPPICTQTSEDGLTESVRFVIDSIDVKTQLSKALVHTTPLSVEKC